jgi:hypothetical protein
VAFAPALSTFSVPAPMASLPMGIVLLLLLKEYDG